MNKKILFTVIPLLIIGGLVAALGMILVAPGVKVNNTPIGSNNVDEALKKVDNQLDNKTVKVDGKSFKLRDLGFYYDKDKVYDTIKDSKAWHISTWNKSITVPVELDKGKAEKVLSDKINSYVKPVDAKVSYKKDKNKFSVKKGNNGHKVDMTKLSKTVNESFDKTNDESEVKLETVNPTATNKSAEKFVKKLNKQSDDAKVVNGKNNIITISSDEFASFIKVKEDKGKFSFDVNSDKVNDFVNGLPDRVNKKADNGSAVVGDDNTVLKVLNAYSDGFTIKNLDNLKENIDKGLVDGDTKFETDGKYTPAKVDKKLRKAVVDLSKRQTSLYENGKLVEKFPVAIGKPATPTDIGKFKVFIQYDKKDMGCRPGYSYCSKDVPWASFYNRGEALHGAPWHNNFGNPNSSAVSHGCVNMRVGDAHKVYKFLQVGSTVEVKR